VATWTRLALCSCLVALLAVACGEPASEGGSSPSAPTSPAPPSETTSPTVEPTETQSPTSVPSPTPSITAELEDGRHFGYIASIDPTQGTMVFDLASFLTGDAANEAAAEHGDETPVPNDYYIVNDNPRLRTLALAPDVELWLIDWGSCCEPVRAEMEPFVDSFETTDHRWDAMYQGAESQYWVTVEDGVVVTIEEQYLP
jgi:hypothetical protein